LSDLTIPAVDFARLDIPVKLAFITENEINGLAFPEMPDSIVVFGLGYGLDRLAEATWLGAKTLYYWGDIDTHGFAILDRLRAFFPYAQSFLMDRTTLMAHRELWGRERDRYERPLSRLTIPEQVLFEELKDGLLGDRVRLEQERISFGWLKQALGEIANRLNRSAIEARQAPPNDLLVAIVVGIAALLHWIFDYAISQKQVGSNRGPATTDS